MTLPGWQQPSSRALLAAFLEGREPTAGELTDYTTLCSSFLSSQGMVHTAEQVGPKATRGSAAHLVEVLASVPRNAEGLDYAREAARLSPDLAPVVQVYRRLARNAEDLVRVPWAVPRMTDSLEAGRMWARLEPDDAQRWIQLGETQMAARRLDEAIVSAAEARRCVGARSGESGATLELHLRLACLLADAGRPEPARALYRAARELAPEHGSVTYLAGRLRRSGVLPPEAVSP